MFWKVIKGILLVGLVIFYAINIYHSRNDLYGAFLLNRINFITLVLILYFAADYIRVCTTLCLLTIVGGILFHGYMYYQVYSADREGVDVSQVKSCRASGESWYSKLNKNCY